MILIREAQKNDIDGLEAFSKLAAEAHPGFLNMASERDQWSTKIRVSNDSFSDKIINKTDSKYIFVAEDLEKKKIVAMSMLTAQHGTPDVPHFYFEVGSEQKYAKSINTGFIHGTLKLKYETNGPTEIGGLLVDPEYRNNDARVGRQISFVRFMYVGMYKNKFKKKILAELLPPLSKKGKCALWEALGRRFTNMDYPEADELSMKNKEFILSLFPTGKIYVTFLPAEARNAIGKVSKDTEPVLHMLQKIGFEYNNQIDPFDGGPHVMANTDDIQPIKNLRFYEYSSKDFDKAVDTQGGLLTPKEKGIKFAALHCDVKIHNHKVFFDPEKAKLVGLKNGESVAFMPYY